MLPKMIFYRCLIMPVFQACADAPEVEAMIRAAVFTKIVEPLAKRWGGATFLAEDFIFRDFFFVKHPGSHRARTSHCTVHSSPLTAVTTVLGIGPLLSRRGQATRT